MVKTDARFFDAMRVLRGTINGLLIVERFSQCRLQLFQLPITVLGCIWNSDEDDKGLKKPCKARISCLEILQRWDGSSCCLGFSSFGECELMSAVTADWELQNTQTAQANRSTKQICEPMNWWFVNCGWDFSRLLRVGRGLVFSAPMGRKDSLCETGGFVLRAIWVTPFGWQMKNIWACWEKWSRACLCTTAEAEVHPGNSNPI